MIVILCAAGGSGTAAPTAGGTPHAPEISVLVFDYAHTPGVLTGALREAARILDSSGIVMNVVACPSEPREIAAHPVCGRSPGPVEVVVRIVDRTASRAGAAENALGFAGLQDRPFPFQAVLFYDRIEERSAKHFSDPAVLLGAAMAHEIGHLLLGEGSHSRSGLMAAVWSADKIHSIEQGRLLFSPAETARMRENLRRRIGLARPMHTSARGHAGPPFRLRDREFTGRK